ncbi:hypothetical protein N7532_001065 [Penicillium argentinense]|uniref:Uncharacterized protein n=1 Tax=Penicillium argentinense TaxID=1131581 RepID=A0A9W9G1U2_9EURO|nr:uncharacterized protein N7532_001065 [Penicillium argentinense]KAJ5110530.1 hypothetical protein N7532_001065 [Penicillium argentinense]
MTDQTQQTPFASPLLALPPEIRLRIYRNAFTPTEDDHPSHYGSLPSDLLRPLHTCRQIYKEAQFLAFSCVSYPLDFGGDLNFAECCSKLKPDLLQAIKSVTICSYVDEMCRGEHTWLFAIPDFDFVKLGLRNLEELVLRPTGSYDMWKTLKPREDAVGGADSFTEITLAAFAKVLLATIRQQKALKRIIVYCRQFVLRKDLPKLQKEFRSEFYQPSFQNWDREEPENAFQNNYSLWARSWNIITVEPDRWMLVSHQGVRGLERSVTLDFRVSDEWEEYHAKYAVSSSSPGPEGELDYLERLLGPTFVEALRHLAANSMTENQGEQSDSNEDEDGYDHDDANDNDQGGVQQ